MGTHPIHRLVRSYKAETASDTSLLLPICNVSSSCHPRLYDARTAACCNDELLQLPPSVFLAGRFRCIEQNNSNGKAVEHDSSPVCTQEGVRQQARVAHLTLPLQPGRSGPLLRAEPARLCRRQDA